ncbi:unnamed protein product [Calypogeia fissa]
MSSTVSPLLAHLGWGDKTTQAYPSLSAAGPETTTWGVHTMQDKEVWSWIDGGGVISGGIHRLHVSLFGTLGQPQYDASINDWRVTPQSFVLNDPVKNVWNLFHKWGVTCAGP